jgi:hypothetical protein
MKTEIGLRGRALLDDLSSLPGAIHRDGDIKLNICDEQAVRSFTYTLRDHLRKDEDGSA